MTMDDYLVFLFPKNSDLAPFNFTAPLLISSGLDYPYGKCNFGKNFILEISEDELRYLERSLPYQDDIDSLIAIRITGNGIDLYRTSLYNENSSEEENHRLQDLLGLLLRNKEKWAVAFKTYFDYPFTIIKGNHTDILPQINKCIKGEVQSGLILSNVK